MNAEQKRTLEIVMEYRKNLSAKARAVLEKMKTADDAENYEDAEIIKDGRYAAWLGNENVSAKIIDELICALLIHAEEEMGSKIQRFTINGDGRRALRGDISVNL
jgi:DNA repair ATPase RecN